MALLWPSSLEPQVAALAEEEVEKPCEMFPSEAPPLPPGLLSQGPRCGPPGTQPEGVTRGFSGQASVKSMLRQLPAFPWGGRAVSCSAASVFPGGEADSHGAEERPPHHRQPLSEHLPLCVLGWAPKGTLCPAHRVSFHPSVSTSHLYLVRLRPGAEGNRTGLFLRRM